MNSSPALVILAVLCVALEIAAQAPGPQYRHELTIKYFSQASMVCDHPDLNVTLSRDIRYLSWMLPDGTIVDASTPLNPRLFTFSAPGTEVKAPPEAFTAYNLTALNVNDDVFGYYTCIIVHNGQGRLPTVVRWGLNVDGADFSDLMETYKTNAIIGGCAAAAMLLIVGGGCLFWNLKYARGKDGDDDDDLAGSDLANVAAVKTHSEAHNNHGYNGDVDVTTNLDQHHDGEYKVNIRM